MDNYIQQWDNLREDASEAITRSYPLKALPLQIRPVIIFILAAWLIVLGMLGMAPLPELPINDKVLHFFGMGIAVFLLYFVIDVPDHARRIWYYRRAPLILTLVCGFFCGGIMSEIVQGWLPWKTFDWNDVLANLLGSSLFFFLAHTLKQRSRKRFEISRLYQPMSTEYNFHSRAQNRFHDLERNGRASPDSFEVDEDDVWGDRHGNQVAGNAPARNIPSEGQGQDGPTEQPFSLGEDEDEDDNEAGKS